jgi:hypothetical protein
MKILATMAALATALSGVARVDSRQHAAKARG